MRFFKLVQSVVLASNRYYFIALIFSCVIAVDVFAVEVPGSTEGQLNVSPDGSASYSVPIRVSPGTAGIEPKIALSYNSRGGPSPVGFGWAVTGLSSVQRGPKDLHEDGEVKGIYLDEKDALYLDGEKLVQIEASSNEYREYRTRVENYSRIRAFAWNSKGPQRLVVETRAGLKLFFGTTEASRVNVGGATLVWLCDRIEDSVGNYMRISYVIEGLDHLVSEIEYTGNKKANLEPYAKVSFIYEKIPVYDVKYVLGEKVEQKNELQKVITSFKGKTLREYSFLYEPIDKYRPSKRLIALRESGADGLSYRPLTFLYSTAAGGWKEQKANFPAALLPISGKNKFKFANITGDAGELGQELLFRYSIGGELKSGVYDFSNSSPVLLDGKWSPPVDLTGDNYLLTDINGDGFADLFVEGPNSFISDQTSGWKEVSNSGLAFHLSPTGSSDKRYLFVDINLGGVKRKLLLWSSPNQSPKNGAAYLDSGKWIDEPKFTPPYPFILDKSGKLNGIYALDVDCDGTPELVYNLERPDGSKMREVYRSSPTGWELIKDNSFSLPFATVPQSDAVKFEDLNNDSCKDAVVAYKLGNSKVQEVWLASKTGWKPDIRKLPDVVFWSGNPGTAGKLGAELEDLDGDGIPEIFWNSNSGASTGAYRLTSTDWTADSSFSPPEPLPDSPQDRSSTFAALRLVKAAKTQLVFFSEQSVPNIYSYSTNGWGLDSQLKPPQNIAQFDKPDLGIRFPDLDGDGYADIAYTRRNVKGELTKVAYLFKPGAQIPWIEDVRYKIPKPTFSEDLKDTGVFLVDFNGDGITDLLYAYQPVDKTIPPVLEAYVNCRWMPECKNLPISQEGGYWKSVTDPVFHGRLKGYVPPVPFAQEGEGALGVRALDINGDGLTDLVVSREEDDPEGLLPPHLVQRVFLNDIAKDPSGRKAGKWRELQGKNILPPVAFTRPKRPALDENEISLSKIRDNRVELVDLDGDRLPDLVFNHLIGVPKPETDEEREKRIKERKPIEFEKQIVSGAYLNRNGHWVLSPAYVPPHRIDTEDNDILAVAAKSSTQINLQDLNGDGLPDLIYAERCDGTCSPSHVSEIRETYINSGTGWRRDADYDIPQSALVKNTKGDQGYRLFDVNADGLADIIYHRVTENGVHEKGAYLNTGMGWKETNENDADVNRDGYAPPLPIVEAGRADLGVRPLDLNGDSIVDLVQTYKRSDAENVTSVWINEPFSKIAGRQFKTDLLAGVVDGLGNETKLKYQSYIGTVFKAGGTRPNLVISPPDRNPEYPVLDPPMPGYIVTSLEKKGVGVESRTSRYRYGDYRVNTLTGKSLGFGVQEIEDADRHRKTKIIFSQEEGVVGNVLSTDVWQDVSIGGSTLPVKISSSSFSFSVVRRNGLSFQSGFTPEILRAKLDLTKNNSTDLHSKLLTSERNEFKYDDNGNPYWIKTTFADGSGSETVNRYDDDLLVWHLARLTDSTVTLFAPKKPSQIRHAKFEYKPTTGQLEKEISLVDDESESAIKYERDIFGNKEASLTSVKSGQPDRKSSVTYDPLGRFPRTSTNNLGQTSVADFDEVSGVITGKTDPNGLHTQVEYDSLQRIRKETDPAGVVTVTTTDFSSDPKFAFTLTKQVGGLPPTISSHDSAGRLLRQTSTGFNGRLVFVDYEYNRLGLLTRSSTPRFKEEAPKYTSWRFDELDRQTEEKRPDGSAVVTRYEGLKTIVLDPLLRTSESLKDERGRTKETVDPDKGKTHFEFDVSGKPIQITNALGQISKVEYNLAGQRIVLDDPTLGIWLYKYNGFGELTEQTDARGELVKLKYDDLGRLVQRSSRAGVATYHFDKGEHAIGRLVSVETSNGASRAINYDQFGRVKNVELEVGEDRSTVEQSYDELGRPFERKYSSGLVVQNAYDKEGFWRQVSISGATHTETVWESLDIDALGRIKKERLGNGVVNDQLFEPDTGRLHSSSAHNAAGTTIQDFTLEYDLVGNVRSRKDGVSKSAESYKYDDLNRITNVSQLMGESIAVEYDALGNIKDKSDSGKYNYCDKGRGKVLCGLDAPDGKKLSFAYDDAGNMVHLGDQTLVFDAEGRVSNISDGKKNQSIFRYGADGELITQQSWAGKTQFDVTYLGDTEIVREAFAPPFNPTPERTRVRHFISSPTGTLGIFETTYWHFPYKLASPMYSMLVMDNPLRSSEVSSAMTYFIKDQLGSLRATLDEKGDILERFDYDPWGKRRQQNQKAYHSVRQGFTGHEHLDNLALVHMGGRVYSPALARFVSPDPFIQYAGYTQSHNRYSYVLNNPFRYIDPSGFWSLGDAIDSFVGGFRDGVGGLLDAVVGKPLSWIGEQLQKAGNWLQQNWQTVAVIAATVALGPAGSYMGAFLIGAAIGGANAALHGGSMEDILRGAVLGGVTSTLFYGVGSVGLENQFVAAGAHGMVGGVSSVMQGGDFGSGFFSAAFTKLSGAYIPASTNTGYQIAVAAVVGGVASELGGGSFENGAITGAFSRMFNDLSCHAESQTCSGVRPTKEEIDAHYRDGTGWPVYAEKMDPSWLTADQFDQIQIGKDGLISTNWNREFLRDAIGDRNIYGSFTATRVDADHFLWRDNYSFEMHKGEYLRNAATLYGRMNALNGDLTKWSSAKSFDIIGTKPVKIPGRAEGMHRTQTLP